MKHLIKIALVVLWLLSPIIGGVSVMAQETDALEDNILSQIAEEEAGPPLEDNFPGFNRAMHDFNFFLDKSFVRPVAKAYKQATPSGARRSIGSFFSNLLEPYSAVNNLLQGETEQAGNNMRRFFTNSLIGVFGLFDVAADMGHAPNHEDFGQTLAVWGVSDGGYLVLPFFGPGSVRSGFGMTPTYVVQTQPVRVPENPNLTTWAAVQYGLLVNRRADDVEMLEDLEANSVDFYSAVKAFYWQNRLNQISQ